MILKTLNEMGNKQLYNFTREQTQVFLTAKLGDGCIYHTKSNSWTYMTNCKHLEYLRWKKELIGKGKVHLLSRNGYSKTPIYEMYGGAYPELEYIYNLSLKETLDNLDYLGLALWFYDDASLHKRDLYYNLNTQKFSKEEHLNILIPYFNTLGINAKLRVDYCHKSPLYYIGINKYEGANIVADILKMFPLNCYSYKLWSSETIQKWSNLQEKVKSTDKVLSCRQLAHIWKTL